MRIRPFHLGVSALFFTVAPIAAPQTTADFTAPFSAPIPTVAQPGVDSNHSTPATRILFNATIRPLPLAATPGAAKPAKASKTPPKTSSFQIAYRLPAGQITVKEDQYGKLHGAVEFDVFVYDARYARIAQFTQTIDVPLTWDQFDQFAASPFQSTQQIELPQGQLWLHVDVHDTVSSRVGAIEFPLLVGKRKPGFGLIGQGASGIAPENPLPCRMPCSKDTYRPQTGGVSSGPIP